MLIIYIKSLGFSPCKANGETYTKLALGKIFTGHDTRHGLLTLGGTDEAHDTQSGREIRGRSQWFQPGRTVIKGSLRTDLQGLATARD